MHNIIPESGTALSPNEFISLLHNRRNDICQRYFVRNFFSRMENIGHEGLYVDLVNRVFRRVHSVVLTSSK